MGCGCEIRTKGTCHVSRQHETHHCLYFSITLSFPKSISSTTITNTKPYLSLQRYPSNPRPGNLKPLEAPTKSPSGDPLLLANLDLSSPSSPTGDSSNSTSTTNGLLGGNLNTDGVSNFPIPACGDRYATANGLQMPPPGGWPQSSGAEEGGYGNNDGNGTKTQTTGGGGGGASQTSSTSTLKGK